MKTKFLKKLMASTAKRFSLHRKYYYFPDGYRYTILKDGVRFNPYSMVHSIKVFFGSDVICSEDEAIEKLKDTIRGYAYDIAHSEWKARRFQRDEKRFIDKVNKHTL